jgi:hypothetical protein
MAAAQTNAVFDAVVKFPPIGGEGDGRMVKTTGAVCGPILEELDNTMPAVMQGIPPDKNTRKLSNKHTAYSLRICRLSSRTCVVRTFVTNAPIRHSPRSRVNRVRS